MQAVDLSLERVKLAFALLFLFLDIINRKTLSENQFDTIEAEIFRLFLDRFFAGR